MGFFVLSKVLSSQFSYPMTIEINGSKSMNAMQILFMVFKLALKNHHSK